MLPTVAAFGGLWRVDRRFHWFGRERAMIGVMSRNEIDRVFIKYSYFSILRDISPKKDEVFMSPKATEALRPLSSISGNSARQIQRGAAYIGPLSVHMITPAAE
ncbi:MAG: hypothetical protein LCH62_10880 [Proteobacteria bacterium]|nr:hypothetical protein [Pseudomonadota bacterium]